MRSTQELKRLINALPDPAAYGRVTPLSSEGFPAPRIRPRQEHPRVMLNAEILEHLKKTVHEAENRRALENYLLRSDAEIEHDGLLPPVAPDADKRYNYTSAPLIAAEAKAFRYLLEGDERYGLEAILILLNFIRTVDCPLPPRGGVGYRGDAYHCNAYTVYISAEIYDWCYPLLTAREREAIVAAVESRIAPNMEMGFPPLLQGAITGHGSESQFLRDWFCFAIATADEYPDIYELVVGRIEAEYVPFREYYFKSGKHSQGNGYGPCRFDHDLLAQYIARTATGESIFRVDFRPVAYSFIHNLRPDDSLLRIGDDMGQRFEKYNFCSYDICEFYAAALLKDPICKHEAFRTERNVTRFDSPESEINEFTAVHFLILNDATVGKTHYSALPFSVWHGAPVGEIIARTSWQDPDATLLYMKIGEKYAGNHEHMDAGQFQIFHRGILAPDTGFYDSYFSPVDSHYTKRTIAHNCILIHDPSEDTGASPNTGGHKHGREESRNLEDWLSKDYTRRGRILGHEIAHGKDGRPTHAYLAGDLTEAYAPQKVREVLRYMSGIFTGNAEHPLLFFVYDRITAASPDFKKTFLLHFVTEPRRAEDGLAIVENKGGALVSQTLLPKPEHRETALIEGSYVVNGEKLEINRFTDRRECCECGWGRLEISPKRGEATDEILHAMYVTDEGKTETVAPAALFESEALVGASLLGAAVFFPRSKKRIDFPFEVEAEGEGELLLQISGVEAGEWIVRRNGVFHASVTVKAESGLLTLRGPRGRYSFES